MRINKRNNIKRARRKVVTFLLVVAMIIIWCTSNGVIKIPGFSFNTANIQNVP